MDRNLKVKPAIRWRDQQSALAKIERGQAKTDGRWYWGCDDPRQDPYCFSRWPESSEENLRWYEIMRKVQKARDRFVADYTWYLRLPCAVRFFWTEPDFDQYLEEEGLNRRKEENRVF